MCGHIVEMWPLIRHLGFPSTYEAICDTCTRERLKLSPDEELFVWVVIPREVEKAVPPVKKAPAKPKVKTVTCSLCRQKGHLFNVCPKYVTEPLM